MLGANGSSELMSNISGSVVGIVYNFQLLKYLGENGISAYGVLMYVQFIFIAIFIGYSIGCAPVISFHYGAGNHSELQSLLKKSTRIVGSLSIILTVLALTLANPLAKMFVGYDAELLAITSHAFKLFSFSFLLAGFNILHHPFLLHSTTEQSLLRSRFTESQNHWGQVYNSDEPQKPVPNVFLFFAFCSILCLTCFFYIILFSSI